MALQWAGSDSWEESDQLSLMRHPGTNVRDVEVDVRLEYHRFNYPVI